MTLKRALSSFGHIVKKLLRPMIQIFLLPEQVRVRILNAERVNSPKTSSP